MSDVIQFPRRKAFVLYELNYEGNAAKYVRDFDALEEAIIFRRPPNRTYGIFQDGKKVWPPPKR
jgi:hypothetical protein